MTTQHPTSRLRACALRTGLALGALLAWLLTAVGCGGSDDRPRPTAAPSPPTNVEGSAFRFLVDPEGVRHDIPLEDVKRGISVPNPRDKIPAILAPRFVPVGGAEHVGAQERVIVVEVGAEARAYPLRILDAHELVNDVLGGEPLLVTWCPLCRSAMVFERRVAGVVRTFGVSGFLYRSDVLMYDHQSESFWSQIAGRAVLGPLSGTPLVERPARLTAFAAFRAEHPEGQVLGPEQEGRSSADYRRSHYDDYHARPGLMFQVDAYDRRLGLKEEVLGVAVGGAAHAWSLAWLRAQPSGPVEVVVGAQALRLLWDGAADEVRVTDAAGNAVAHLRCYWFAWYAFHQDTGLTGGASTR